MLDSRILPRTKMRWASSTTKMLKNPGFPFDVAQGGEPVEPRVKPGMTNSSMDRLINYDKVYAGGR